MLSSLTRIVAESALSTNQLPELPAETKVIVLFVLMATTSEIGATPFDTFLEVDQSAHSPGGETKSTRIVPAAEVKLCEGTHVAVCHAATLRLAT